jgi:hypothetical protein
MRGLLEHAPVPEGSPADQELQRHVRHFKTVRDSPATERDPELRCPGRFLWVMVLGSTSGIQPGVVLEVGGGVMTCRPGSGANTIANDGGRAPDNVAHSADTPRLHSAHSNGCRPQAMLHP